MIAVPGGGPVKKDDEEWRQPIPIDMTFGVGLKTRSRRHRPAHISFWGCAIFVFYIATFLFYAYCRIGHTLNRHDSAFAYQVGMLYLFLRKRGKCTC